MRNERAENLQKGRNVIKWADLERRGEGRGLNEPRLPMSFGAEAAAAAAVPIFDCIAAAAAAEEGGGGGERREAAT